MDYILYQVALIEEISEDKCLLSANVGDNSNNG